MKLVFTFVAAAVVGLIASSSDLRAQDMMKTSPEMDAILVDTTLVRASVVTVEPGMKSQMHTHPAHFFYALTDGKLLVTYSDGKQETYDLKAGESGFSNPERPHVVENAGDATVKFLLVELKEHPYKAPKKK